MFIYCHPIIVILTCHVRKLFSSKPFSTITPSLMNRLTLNNFLLYFWVPDFMTLLKDAEHLQELFSWPICSQFQTYPTEFLKAFLDGSMILEF